MVSKTNSSPDEAKEIKEVQETIQKADPVEEQPCTRDDIIQEIRDRVEENAAKIDAIVDELVYQHCKEVDELMIKYKSCLLDKEHPVTDWELDDVCTKLTGYLYFVGEAQEKFGIREDIAKSVKMERYNEVHRRTKGTIADKQAASEAATLEEEIVYKSYQRAYKRIKQKLEAAYEVVSSIKKVMSRRMGEQELANIDSGKFRKV